MPERQQRLRTTPFPSRYTTSNPFVVFPCVPLKSYIASRGAGHASGSLSSSGTGQISKKKVFILIGERFWEFDF
uniref:Uncharacterized protein n=1 Tax=Solanum tuberosum TaxID=4113 RepID=M1CYU8_SOLTU